MRRIQKEYTKEYSVVDDKKNKRSDEIQGENQMTGTHTYDSKSDLSNLKYHVNLGSFWTIHYYSSNIRPHTIIKNYSAIKKNTKRQRKKRILGPLCHFQ